MTEGFSSSGGSWRIDSPESVRERRNVRRAAKSYAGGRLRPGTATAIEGEASRTFAPQPIDSTLREQLDAHARSLGETLFARQAEIDRREADVHARLATLETMRRELELWSQEERSALAAERIRLEERSISVETESRVRRLALDRREETLANAFASLERAQAKTDELQKRCEDAMRRFDSEARTRATDLPLRRNPSDAAESRVAEAHALVRELANATVFRVVRPDRTEGDDTDEASPDDRARSAEQTPSGADGRATCASPPASQNLIRLHEALLDKERRLEGEARKLERERKSFFELRMKWIEERLQNDRLSDGVAALAELRALRAEIDRERQDRVQGQKRRHQRMQHLLEAIEDEITRLDIAWASVPPR